MDKIIKESKRQLHDMKQTLKMRDLLQQYDRQNQHLNHQVDLLLKQNIKLKQQNAIISCGNSRVFTVQQFYSKESKKSPDFGVQRKVFSSNKTRKSRYNYMFDEDEITNIKYNIKNQIKKDVLKMVLTKQQFQTNNQQQNIHKLFTKYQNNISINKPQQIRKLFDAKFTPVKKSPQRTQRRGLQITQSEGRLSKSKSKQKVQYKKKGQSETKSRLYEQQKNISTTQPQTSSPDEQKQQSIKQVPIKQQELYILEHSFGHNSQQKLIKKFTLLESDLLPSMKQQNKIQDSRISNKFIPLSIQSKQISKQISTDITKQLSTNITKQLSTNINKSQFPSISYNQSMLRTESKSKKNHCINPSPKVDFHPNQIHYHYKTKNLILKTQQAIQSRPLHRDPSQKIKRKFIQIVSSKKKSQPQSPQKK